VYGMLPGLAVSYTYTTTRPSWSGPGTYATKELGPNLWEMVHRIETCSNLHLLKTPQPMILFITWSRSHQVRHDKRPPVLVDGSFLTACPLRRYLVATLTLNHGSHRIPTTKRQRRNSLLIERGHRSHESCEGGFERYASEGGFWLRQCHPHND